MTLDNEPTAGDDASNTTTDSGSEAAAPAKRARRRVASRPAGPPTGDEPATPPAQKGEPATPPAKKVARKRVSKKAAAAAAAPADVGTPDVGTPDAGTPEPGAAAAPAKKTARKRASKKAAAAEPPPQPSAVEQSQTPATAPAGGVLFQAPDLTEAAPPRRRRAASRAAGQPQPSTSEASGSTASAGPEAGAAEEPAAEQRPSRSRRRRLGAVVPDDEQGAATDGDVTRGGAAGEETGDQTSRDQTDAGEDDSDDDDAGDGKRRRRRRGGRGRRKRAGDEDGDTTESTEGDAGEQGSSDEGPDGDADDDGESASSRRRRRRRRRGGGGGDGDESPGPDDPPNTVVKVRQPRKAESKSKSDGRSEGKAEDEVTGLKGSTRLEAKRQRRREGRDSGRRKPIVTEAEFLARRESVERVMVVREREGRTQIGVLEDGVLVEHYVARKSQASMVGNVYLGKVQNVLPSMEAAFVDIGKGRNAVLYAGEVNWDAAGMQGQPRRIELALKSGDPVLVQVTKDPIGHKGARLTSQVSLAGRYLVYVPNGSMTGISRKLPDTERARLKKILKAVVPDEAGVIVRTASEGASESELERDVARLQEQWAGIEKLSTAASAPALLHGEPDLTVRVIRDVFNEDFVKLVVSGDEAWGTVQEYVGHVAPDLADRMERYTGDQDVFAVHRVDEQIAKAVDRKVWLPSGGSLVIDRTEAMTVVDVNTGKFVGSGGNLEATVTKNNIEAAEEIVRQLRLRDVGGIIVIDFIDMVLESNRDLVMRRLLECLGRDRTKHQVAEVTSLGLVQMTRKRVGQGLLDAFSEPCEHCGGRGVILHDEPVEAKAGSDGGGSGGGRGGRGDSGSSGPAQDGRQTSSPPRGKGEAARIAEAARQAAAKEHHDHTDVPEVASAALGSSQPVGRTPQQPAPEPLAPEPAGSEVPPTAAEPPTAVEQGRSPSGPTPSPEPEPTPEPTQEPAPKRRGRRRAGSPVTTPKSADASSDPTDVGAGPGADGS